MYIQHRSLKGKDLKALDLDIQIYPRIQESKRSTNAKTSRGTRESSQRSKGIRILRSRVVSRRVCEESSAISEFKDPWNREFRDENEKVDIEEKTSIDKEIRFVILPSFFFTFLSSCFFLLPFLFLLLARYWTNIHYACVSSSNNLISPYYNETTQTSSIDDRGRSR